MEPKSGYRVITVIEFLSPSNKVPGEGQKQYQKKQQETRDADISLVEIDLTRSGIRALLAPQDHIPPSHRTTCQVCVYRGYVPFKYEIYPLPLREKLPTIAVPLRQNEGDVPLDIQALVELAYENGRYDDIDYRADAHPPLTGEEAAWAGEVLRSKGIR